MTQPFPLFIADVLEDAAKPSEMAEKAAAELRRLHAENEAMVELVKELVAERDVLREAFGKTRRLMPDKWHDETLHKAVAIRERGEA